MLEIISIVASAISFFFGIQYGIYRARDHVAFAKALIDEADKKNKALVTLRDEMADVIVDYQREYFKSGAEWMMDIVFDSPASRQVVERLINDQCKKENFDSRIEL